MGAQHYQHSRHEGPHCSLRIISDNLRSLAPVTWTSYPRLTRIKHHIFLQTSLRFRNTILAWHDLREMLRVSIGAFLYLQSCMQLA